MIKKIAHGYSRLFSSVAKIIILAGLCLFLAVIIVYPLWKWALAAPKTYSAAVITVAAAGFIYLLAQRIRRQGALTVLRRFLKLLVVVGGLTGCIECVLHAHRIASLIVLAVTFVVYGILAFGFRDKQDNATQSE